MLQQSLACPACKASFVLKAIPAPGQQLHCRQCGHRFDLPAGTDAAPRREETHSGVAGEGAAGRVTVGGAASPREPAGALHGFLRAPEQPGELGRLGSYRVLEVLGAGGMGVVFRAEDPRLQRQVALKTLRPAVAQNARARERFLREARATAAIEHEHIVAIFQIDEDQGVPFLAMPLLKGQDLSSYIKECVVRRKSAGKSGALSTREVLRIGWEIAEGLAAAHARGLVHRDVKPSNVWLDGEKRRVKLLDFGLARLASASTQLTRQGSILGTPAYMAPEQVRSSEVDFRADLFSLGCVLYQMVAGELPFQGHDTLAILASLASEEPRPLQELKPGLPPNLSELILQLLAKKPEDRPASAAAVAQSLRAIGRALMAEAATKATLAGESGPMPALIVDPAILARRPAPSPGLVARLRGLPRWSIGVAVICVLLLCSVSVLGLLALRNGPGPGSRRPEPTAKAESPPERRPASLALKEPVPDPIRPPKVIITDPLPRPLPVSPVPAKDDTPVPPVPAKEEPPQKKEAPLPVPPVPAKEEPTPKKEEVVAILRGHTSIVRSLAISADGRRLVSSGKDKKVLVWDGHSYASLGIKLDGFGPQLDVDRVAISSDGDLLATGGGEAKRPAELKLWDLNLGTQFYDGPSHKGRVRAVAFSHPLPKKNPLLTYPVVLATGSSSDETIHLWDPKNMRNGPISSIAAGGKVYSLAFNPVSNLLVGGLHDGSIRCWVLGDTSKPVWQLKAESLVKCLAISPDGLYLATNGMPQTGTAIVWDVAARKPLRTLDGHDGEVYSVAFHPKNELCLAVGSYKVDRWERSLLLWDARNGREIRNLRGHSAGVHAVLFHPDGQRLFSAGQDATIRVWDTSNLK